METVIASPASPQSVLFPDVYVAPYDRILYPNSNNREERKSDAQRTGQEEENRASCSTRKSFDSFALDAEVPEEDQRTSSNVPVRRIRDYEVLRQVGQGSYGRVLLVRKANSGQLFAMKVIDKSHVSEQQLVNSTKAELGILAGVSHPNVVRLIEAFHTARSLYLVMEYCPGGQLFFQMEQEKFAEGKARFYAANVLLALSHLHSRNVVYRDLKPENVLVGADGYARVSDFGLSKRVSGLGEKLSSFCGTPEYMAPEVVWKSPYTKDVDWWTFGALIYEMVTGTPPFVNESRYLLYKSIQFDQPIIPNSLTPELQDLLEKLMEKDPKKRLGAKNDAEEVKTHPWFAGVDWQQMLDKRVKPPYVPESGPEEGAEVLCSDGEEVDEDETWENFEFTAEAS